MGPTIKPSENATPTKAMPRPRVLPLLTSVMMDMLNDILPLLRPPTKRAKTKTAKLRENAHSKYDKAMPALKKKKYC